MNGEPENYLKSKRFNVGRRKGSLLSVSEIDARKAVRMAREQTAQEFLGWLVSKDRQIGRGWTPRQFELFGILQKEFKEEFLQEGT